MALPPSPAPVPPRAAGAPDAGSSLDAVRGSDGGRAAGDRRSTAPIGVLDGQAPLGAPAERLSAYTMELPVYVPGEAIDEGYVPQAPTTRGIRPRQRSTLQRILIGLSSTTLLLVVAVVLTLATILSPIGSRREARAVAEQELRSELEPGERIVERAYVSQRRWSDNFRESYGVLAATERRLLYVGVPPAPWLTTGDEVGPPELRVQEVPYEVPFTTSTPRELLGLVRGVEVRVPAGVVTFLVSRGEAERAREIERVVARALQARTAAQQREAQARIAPPPPPQRYGTHVVRAGEALSVLARRYGTSSQVLRELNRLTTDAVRIGQRLRVPLPSAADSVGPPGAPQAISY